MAPYFVLFTFSFFITVLSINFKKYDKVFGLILFIVLVLFVGFRYESVDYYGYWWIYENVREIGLSGFSKETGFSIIVLIEQSIFGHFFYFVFLFSLLSLAIKYSALSKISSLITLALFIYICSPLLWKDLGQIRNGFVAGMMLYAVYYVSRKEYVRFTMAILLATQIHATAIIGLLIVFAPRLTSRNLMFVIYLSAFVIALFGGLGKPILNLVGMDSLGQLSYRAHSYIGGEYDVEKNVLGIASLVNFILINFLIYHYDRLKNAAAINYYLVPMVVIGGAAEYFFADFGIVGARIADILLWPALIAILSNLYLISAKKQRIFIFIAVLGYCATYFIFSSLSAQYPYQNIIQLI